MITDFRVLDEPKHASALPVRVAAVGTDPTVISIDVPRFCAEHPLASVTEVRHKLYLNKVSCIYRGVIHIVIQCRLGNSVFRVVYCIG